MNEPDTLRQINLDFVDFGHVQSKESYYFLILLRERFPVQVTMRVRGR